MAETQTEFGYMSKDIEKLNKGLSKSKIFAVMDKTSSKIRGVVDQLKEMENTLRTASFRIDDLKQNLKQGRNFFDTFKKDVGRQAEFVLRVVIGARLLWRAVTVANTGRDRVSISVPAETAGSSLQ